MMLFAEAVAIGGANRWPLEYARLQLAHGEQLRRSRALSASRIQLSRALDTFQALGAMPWARRAASELRATGLSRPSATAPRAAALTPQELEIAMLAARGMTNKDIAERLYLSSRTVGAHLYRIFPKLGITSRAALRDALGAQPDLPQDGPR
jgi:DNA-binding NarL/FixJ family response regulator